MANYNFVVNSKFRPLTYDEIVKPLQQQQELHNMYEDAYADLSIKAEALRQRAEADPDSEWSKRFMNYANSLEQSANELAERGLNAQSRARINKARSSFATDIVPIQNAITLQSELAKQRRAQNPALRMYNSDMPTIDQLIIDPNLSPVSYSGAAVEQSAQELAKAAATRNVNSSFGKHAGIWMKEFQSQGFNKNTINKFLQNAEGVPELARILNQVSSQFNNFEGMNDQQKEALKADIVAGIMKGATYTEKSDYKQNPLAIKMWEFDEAERRAKLKEEESARRAAMINIGDIDPVDYHRVQRDENVDRLIELGMLSKDANGRVSLSNNARQAVQQFNAITSQHPELREQLLSSNDPSKLISFIQNNAALRKDPTAQESLLKLLTNRRQLVPVISHTTGIGLYGGNEDKFTNNYDLLNTVLSDYSSSNRGGFDFSEQAIADMYSGKAPITINSETGFRYKIDSADQDKYKSVIRQAASPTGKESDLKVYEYSDKGWKAIDDKISTSDLFDQDTKTTQLMVVPINEGKGYDVLVRVEDKKGNIKMVKLPEGRDKDKILAPFGDTEKLRSLYNMSSDQGQDYYNALYQARIGDAYSAMGLYGRTNTTEDQKWQSAGTTITFN